MPKTNAEHVRVRNILLRPERTKAERMREDRARKKEILLTAIATNEIPTKPLGRSATQRMREYRARKKALRMATAATASSEGNSQSNTRCSDDEDFSLMYVTDENVKSSTATTTENIAVQANVDNVSASLQSTGARKTYAQRLREHRERKMAAEQARNALAVQRSVVASPSPINANVFSNPTRYERERAAMKNKARKVLNLEERVLAIRLYQDNPVYQRVASTFRCSWEQIRNVIANRDDILRYYGECQTIKPTDSPQYVRNKKINFLGNVIYEFIKRAHYHRSAVLNDDVIRQRALKISNILRIEKFHPIMAWLQDFKRVYNIDWTNLDSLIICNKPPATLDCKDLIDYCTRMVAKAVSLIGKVPKPIAKKASKDEEDEDDEYDDGGDGDNGDYDDGDYNAAGGENLGAYGDNQSDSMLMDSYDDVPVVNEIDDYAGMYNHPNITHGHNTDGVDDESIINDDIEAEATIASYVDYDDGGVADGISITTKRKRIPSTVTQQLCSEVQIKQERCSRSRSPSPLMAASIHDDPVQFGVSTSIKDDTKHNTKINVVDDGETAATTNQLTAPVNSYADALRALSPLEDFATQQENFQALNLLSQLIRVFEKGAKRNHEPSKHF